MSSSSQDPGKPCQPDRSLFWAKSPRPFAPACTFAPFREEDIEQSISARFEAQAFDHPSRLALKTGNATLTYRELNRQANRVAHAIRARHEGTQQPIAYLLDDDAKAVVANLAILKSGNLYVPLDPQHPPARTAEILQDSQAVLIVTDDQHVAAARALSQDIELLNIDDVPADISAENLGEAVSPDSLARIVYTSGSTGRPKGVLHNHRGLLVTAMNVTNSLRISPLDHIALLSARTSAQAISIIYSALLNGARLCPFATKQEGIDRLAAWLLREEITIYHSNAAIFSAFMRTLAGNEAFPSLRVIKLGGDAVSKKELALCRKHFSQDCVFVNALSSTEAGTFRQYIVDRHTEIASDTVSVGHPVFGMDVVLLDETGQPVAPGHIGEIAVRSRHLALGYWRKPELTDARFLPDPNEADLRTYRTGDLGRLSPDGCLHYLGRKDFQVKIRGNRVEPSEVEMALADLAAVQQAVVVARKDRRGETFLAAYIVPEATCQLRIPELRSALRKKLPDYMVPSVFVSLAELPLSPQGKIDRQALPDPVAEREYLPPHNPVEAQLVEIWEEVLGLHPIGVLDDFFEIGGDSLLAVCVMNRIEESFSQYLPVWTFFNAATVQEMARAIVGELKFESRSPFLNGPPRDSQRPFFFLHGQLNGEGFYCLNLARYLGDQIPFYALQPLGPPGPVPETIEAVATHYLKLLRQVQPHGPYLLGGYCNGGIVAFEIAQQLRAQKEKVERLVVIDGVARNAEYRMHHRLAQLAARLLRLSPREELDVFVRLRNLPERFSVSSDLDRARLETGTARLKAYSRKSGRLLRRFLGANPSLPAPTSGEATFGGSADWNRIAEQRSVGYGHILNGYVAHRYPGRITVFRAQEREGPLVDPTLGWRHVTRDVDLHVIPGDHQTIMLNQENLAVLAEHLKSCLRQESRAQQTHPDSAFSHFLQNLNCGGD